MTSELSTSEAATPTSPPEATPSDPRRGNLALAAVLLAVLVVPMSISGTAVRCPPSPPTSAAAHRVSSGW
ncbi:hypothetical protein [Rhodococcus opacus]|uniref:hypothetical protein n=1 Tax=Rhodococcus opacus TaxID=37919 RepID=UPI001E54F0CD|nr:hypothetical protein [Rhodococcus opacus]